MKTYELSAPKGLDALSCQDRPDAPIGARDVRVDMKAWSLNFRDLNVPLGGYPGNDKIVRNPPLVPLSDGSGEVVEIGSDVEEFSVGDKVTSSFFRDWESGTAEASQLSSALGGGIDGTLAERVVLPERGWVKAPSHLTYEEASTLPCAALTAWQSLTAGNLIPGQSVLAQGTGGVSIFTLQLAKAGGARVIITSSSNEKLEKARSLGADVTINYREQPDWEEEVLAATNGVGVDQVVEVGGSGTLEKSIASVRVGGVVSLVGILSGPTGGFSSIGAILNAVTLRGIFVGSKEMFKLMNASIEVSKLRPAIDQVFGFDSLEEVKAAYDHLRSAKHFGKVVISRV